MTLVRILANDRSRIDTFRNSEWDEFMRIESGLEKAEWIKNNPNKQVWKKKSGAKVQVTQSFKTLLIEVQKLNCLSIGAKEIPICLIEKANIRNFIAVLKSIYPYDAIKEVVTQIIKQNKPFIIVWITGFKPRGDDSRPDRGLVPMTRMLFGNDIDILTIVSGPAGKNTWRILKEYPQKLAHMNGLWEAVINLSNYVLADSITSSEGVIATLIQRNIKREKQKVIFDAAKPNGIFSEHDVDTAIHTLFSRQLDSNIFESMCNPPGGDWSGISYWDFTDETEYRWTSLPRVSSIQAKRPDHIIHINTTSDEIFLVIESKNHSRDLETNIGSRLVEYVKVLFKVAPTAHKLKNKDWKLFEDIESPLKKIVTLSGGAFCYTNFNDLERAMAKGNLDFIFAFEFKKDGLPSIGHLLTTEKSQFLVNIITKITSQFNGRFEIKIY